MIQLEFNNGYTIQVAKKHVLQQNNKDVFAESLAIGSPVDHIDGLVYITNITEIENQDCFDIGIETPHLYYDRNGLLHHNTIMTAALSKSIEPYGRSIVIVPNKSLVVQTEADYINMGLNVGVYFGDRKEFGRQHTICTWQSLNNLLKNTKSGDADITIGDFIEGVVCVMVDECFDGEAKVLTPNGYVPIKSIKPGDKVINYSEFTNEFKIDDVVEQHANLSKSSGEKMYRMEFDNGSIIEVTGNHKFLTKFGWVRADELTENHEIITPNINTDN